MLEQKCDVHGERKVYLVVDVGGPEAGNGSFIGVRREDGRAGGERLVDVLHDEVGLADRRALVDEHRNLLVHRVGAKQELALVGEVLLDVLVAQALEGERKLHPDGKRAWPCAEQLQVVSGADHDR